MLLLSGCICFSFSLASCQTADSVRQVPPGDSLLSDTTAVQMVDKSAATENIYQARHTAITRAVADASPTVVGINVTAVKRILQRVPLSLFFPEFYRERMTQQQVESLGSGFFISDDGYIVTNEHVVEDAAEILITTTDGRHLKAELIGADRDTDIALLKVEGKGFPHLSFGRTDDLIVGEWVIALGNPFGLVALNDQPTVTVGVISAIDRDWGRTSRGALYMDMIQTDAAINHGNSGGPLVNSLGQVIGMNTFILSGNTGESGSVGIGFAIPIDRVQTIVNEIREKGRVNRDFWLGIDQVISLNRRIIRALKLEITHGALILAIEPNSPADRAGLKEYDVITAFNGKPVRNQDDFITQWRNTDTKVGTEVSFTVIRDGKQSTFTVTLEPNPRAR